MQNKIIKILAIDDSNDSLIILEKYLKRVFPNAILYCVLNGKDAITVTKREDPDVILLDIAMPGMDGFEVSKRIKQDEAVNDIPIIFITGYRTDRESRVKALDIGVEGFLTKPIDEIELTAGIRAMVRIKVANREKRAEKERLALMVEEQTHELKKSEEKYRFLIENSHDIIYTLSNDGIFTFVSPSWTIFLGHDITDVIGHSFQKFVHPDDVPVCLNSIKTMLDSGERQEGIEYRVLHKNGVWRWHTSSGVPLINQEGKIISIQGTARDITERKNSDTELHKLSRAVEQSPASVIITDRDGSIEYVNKKFTLVTGYSKVEVVNQNPRVLKSGFQDKIFYENLWNTILSGKEWAGELQNKKKSGELYWESALIYPLVNKDKEITHFIAVKEDITEKKKMIEDLVIAKEKAEEMSRLKTNFLNNMSHELRTPLNGIMGYASILSTTLADAEAVHMTQTIYDAAKRLSETLNLLIDLSQTETDKFQLSSKNISVLPIIDQVVKIFTDAADKKNLQLETVVTAKKVCAKLDTNLFEQTIHNLVSNAIKFTNGGKITIEIGNETTDAQEWVYIKVIDTGIGIPEDKIDLIWDEFRQVSEGISRSFEGSGLGLTISKKIVELMNGVITVESKLGVGSIFKVKFLACNEASEAIKLKQKDEMLISGKIEEREKGTTILQTALYVEDDLINQNVMKLYLKNICNIETAQDGKSALALLTEKNYDLILMDINLGEGMDGMAVTKEIRKMPQYAATPIVAVTAYAMEKDKKEFLAGGCTHFLPKPFEKKEVIELLMSMFKSKQIDIKE